MELDIDTLLGLSNAMNEKRVLNLIVEHYKKLEKENITLREANERLLAEATERLTVLATEKKTVDKVKEKVEKAVKKKKVITHRAKPQGPKTYHRPLVRTQCRSEIFNNPKNEYTINGMCDALEPEHAPHRWDNKCSHALYCAVADVLKDMAREDVIRRHTRGFSQDGKHGWEWVYFNKNRPIAAKPVKVTAKKVEKKKPKKKAGPAAKSKKIVEEMAQYKEDLKKAEELSFYEGYDAKFFDNKGGKEALEKITQRLMVERAKTVNVIFYHNELGALNINKAKLCLSASVLTSLTGWVCSKISGSSRSGTVRMKFVRDAKR